MYVVDDQTRTSLQLHKLGPLLLLNDSQYVQVLQHVLLMHTIHFRPEWPGDVIAADIMEAAGLASHLQFLFCFVQIGRMAVERRSRIRFEKERLQIDEEAVEFVLW